MDGSLHKAIAQKGHPFFPAESLGNYRDQWGTREIVSKIDRDNERLGAKLRHGLRDREQEQHVVREIQINESGDRE